MQQSGERGKELALFGVILGSALTALGLIVAVVTALFVAYLAKSVASTSLDPSKLDPQAVSTLNQIASQVAAAQQTSSLEDYSLPARIEGPASLPGGEGGKVQVPKDYAVFLYEAGDVCIEYYPGDKSTRETQGWWHVFPGDAVPREWGCPPLDVGPVRL